MRLDGWKSIAAYFNRERTTVIRWSAERGLPVHRIPGKGRGSVYALTDELDAWLEASREQDSRKDEAQVATASTAAPGWDRRWIGAIVLAAVLLLSLAVYAGMGGPARRGTEVPRDPAAAAVYVEARADWARRTEVSILSAIGKLQRVVTIEPDFAPAYSALADSYLLAREFGSLSDMEAFSRAQIAVDTALKIDPDQASALRAKGFIDYWWKGDRESAGRHFRRALAIGGKSAQTEFWLANALVDNGEFDEGMRHFVEAQLIEPASPAIATDLAWAYWSTGETARAKADLLALRRDHPSLATVSDYLAVIALAEGDMATFVAETENMARLRREDSLIAHAAELRTALGHGPSAVAARVVNDAVAEVASGDRHTLVWPAFVASSAGDRSALIEVLRKADARKEVWGSAGLLRHMRGRWNADTEITALIDARHPREFLMRAY